MARKPKPAEQPTEEASASVSNNEFTEAIQNVTGTTEPVSASAIEPVAEPNAPEPEYPDANTFQGLLHTIELLSVTQLTEVITRATTLKAALVGPRNKSSCESPVLKVLTIADDMKGAQRKDVIAACVNAGVNIHTAKTQYQRWKEAQKADAAVAAALNKKVA